MIKVGIFGGTFSPPHIGHLRLAEVAKELLNLEKVIFIPSGNPPHKSGDDVRFSPDDRLKMVTLSIQDVSYFEVSDFEVRKKEKSYTIDTLNYFKNKNPEYDIVFIAGSDQLFQIKSWKSWEKLLSYFKFAFAIRPGDSEKKVFDFLRNEKIEYILVDEKSKKVDFEKNVFILRINTLINLSSTYINELIDENKSIRYLVKKEVEEYIKKNKMEVNF